MRLETILKPCRVPWAISPSTSGVTLTHSESDVEPECTVVAGGCRLIHGHFDNLRIEIKFNECYYARVFPHADTESIEAIGYRIDPACQYDGPAADYLEWREHNWNATGLCPDPGFFVATCSVWLANLATKGGWFQQRLDTFQDRPRHYVINGRDGGVEVIASGFNWREWIWYSNRDTAPSEGPVVGYGKGVE